MENINSLVYEALKDNLKSHFKRHWGSYLIGAGMLGVGATHFKHLHTETPNSQPPISHHLPEPPNGSDNTTNLPKPKILTPLDKFKYQKRQI